MGRRYAKRKKKATEYIWFRRVKRTWEGTEYFISTFEITSCEPPPKEIKGQQAYEKKC